MEKSIDMVSFEAFFNNYYPKAISYTKRKIGNNEDAEDLVSDSFLYCYKNYDKYDEEKASRSTWFFLVLNSRIKNYYRDKKEYVEIDPLIDYLVDEKKYIESALELDDLRKEITKALKKLPEIQREIVILKYFHEMSSKDIASKLTISEGNVRTTLSRALVKLRKTLDGEEPPVIKLF